MVVFTSKIIKMDDESNASRRVGILRRPDPESNDSKSYPSTEINSALKELELTVPNVNLRSSPRKPEDCNIERKAKVNMAYWLKPTPVQVYPYQFFIAACKKLEAITNPVVRGKTEGKNISKSLPSGQKIGLENNLNKTSSSDKKDNESTKLKSPNSSYNQQIPSLSTEGIDNLKVQSKSFEHKASNRKHTSDEHPFINSKRGCEVNSRALTSFESNIEVPLIPGDLNSSNALEMLEIFNKGLSRAILDSRKLHEALSGSIRDGVAHKSSVKSNPATSVGYSSTFESITDSNDDPEVHETVTNINNTENIVGTRNGNESEDEKTSNNYSTDFEETVSELDVNTSEAKTASRMSSKDNRHTNEEKSNNSNILNENPSNSTNVQNSQEHIADKKYSSINNGQNQIQSKYINYSRGSDNESHIKLNSTNQSIGSEVYTVLNQTDVEFSMFSENTVSYSRLGLVSEIRLYLNFKFYHIFFKLQYECLINSENQKSKDLTTLLKLREKSLIDRTKGQIAWLELQKQKFKEQGLTAQISAVKKKQRAILVSLDKERASIHRYDFSLR